MSDALVQAVQGTPFDLKTLTDTFAAVADRNMKSRELDIRSQEAAQNSVLKAAGLDLREQALALRTNQASVAAQGRELSNTLTLQKLQSAQLALQEAREYNEAVAGATKDGKSLTVRLRSDDPAEADEAYRTFSAIRDKFRASVSPIVNADIKAMEGLPYVIAKQKLAEKKEEERATEAARRGDQKDRRLDQNDNVISETERHHTAQEGLGQERIVIGERNATTREKNSDLRAEGKGGGAMGMTLPNLGYVSMDKIRGVLARGNAQDATAQEVSDADVLRKSILAVPSGNKNPDTGANIPRFTNDDLVKWTTEGQSAAKAKPAPAAPVPARGPESRPGATPRKRPYAAPPAPELPAGGVTSAPAAPATTTAAPESLPPVPPPAQSTGTPPADGSALMPQVIPPPTPAASDLLKRYKIPARPKTGAVDAEPATPDALYGATQNYLAELGIVQQPTPMVGFGGFGFALPPA